MAWTLQNDYDAFDAKIVADLLAKGISNWNRCYRNRIWLGGWLTDWFLRSYVARMKIAMYEKRYVALMEMALLVSLRLFEKKVSFCNTVSVCKVLDR